MHFRDIDFLFNQIRNDFRAANNNIRSQDAQCIHVPWIVRPCNHFNRLKLALRELGSHQVVLVLASHRDEAVRILCPCIFQRLNLCSIAADYLDIQLIRQPHAAKLILFNQTHIMLAVQHNRGQMIA